VNSAWIIGAGSGIGAALADKLSRQGVRLILSGRSPEKLEGVAQRMLNPVTCEVLDVTEVESVNTVWQKISADRVPNLIVISSGDYVETPLSELSPEISRHLMEVNYQGVVNLMSALLPKCLEQGCQIAVVASLAGYTGLPKASAYGASKAAVINYIESLKLELLDTSVDLRLINPGFVKTPLTDKNQFKMPDLITAEQAATEIVKGLSGTAFEIRFPKRFARIMSFISLLPYRIKLSLIKRITRA
jgi:short-subunit dehydrogenase